jgi:hypothetical protein
MATQMQNAGRTPSVLHNKLCNMLCSPFYIIGLTSANTCLPCFPAAIQNVEYGAMMLWGGLQ